METYLIFKVAELTFAKSSFQNVWNFKSNYFINIIYVIYFLTIYNLLGKDKIRALLLAEKLVNNFKFAK